MTREKFNEYVLMHSRKIYGFAFRILRNQEEAEDVVQEIFIKLWRMGDKLDHYDSIDALATTMTKNYCIDQMRKRKKMVDQKDTDNYQVQTSPSPHDQLENLESAEILHKIIADMDKKTSEVVRLRDIEGFSYEEIAEKTGQNINTLRVILSRARGFIRDEYIKYNYEYRRSKQAT